MRRFPVLLSLLLPCFAGCASQHTRPPARVMSGATAPVPSAQTADAEIPIDWKKEIGDVLVPSGPLHATLNEKQQVYTVTISRDDLDVSIDGMSVPMAAGIASNFHFYRCSCGKISVLGEFIVVDYEANDVIDALRPGNTIQVTAVSQIAIGVRPPLLSVRFHGEGEATPLANLIREAMRWTGTERMRKPNAQ
jgi:hypothetical protein